MTHYIRFILRFRLFVVALFLLITAVFGHFLMQATITSSIGELFFSNNPKYERYLANNNIFGGDNLVLVAYSGDDILSRESLDRLRRTVAALEKNPDVERVESLLSAQHITSSEDQLLIEDYAGLFESRPGRRDELLQELATDALTKDWLVSRDGRTAMVIVEFVSDDRGFETVTDTFNRVWEEFSHNGFETQKLHRGGLVALFAEMYKESVFSVTGILPIAAAALFIFVFLMFRRFWPVLVTLVITGMAIIWTMGMGVLLYGHLNIFTTMVPTVILITCFADVIHLCSAYLLELSHGRNKQEAILLTGKEVGTACAYTSITTFLGFISMTMVPTPVFKQFGLLMGFGVGAALFMALTLVPIFLSVIPKPKPWRRGSTSTVQGLLDRTLNGCDHITRTYPRLTVGGFAVFFLVSVYGITQLHFETHLSKRFGEDNPIRVSQQFFEKKFPGISPMNIYLKTDTPEGLIDPETFARIADFQQWINALEPVHHVVSVVDLVRKMYRELNPEMAAAKPLPDTPEALAQLLLLFELQGGRDLERFIDYDHQTLVLKARFKDVGVIETADIGNAIVAEGKKRFGDAITVDPLGLDYLTGDWVDDILVGQRNGLLFACATIAIMMIIALRSIPVGLLSMFPNALPLLALMGYMGLFWDIADTDTLMVLMVTIGVGVDDTIHFLARLKFEFAKTDDPAQAVNQALHYAGRAIIMSSVILVAGFSAFATSDYFSVHIFGTLLPASLFVALVADVLLVPAMVHLGWIRFRPGTA